MTHAYLCAVLATVVSGALSTTSGSSGKWSQLINKAPWSARSDPQLAVLNGKLLLMGGHANNDYFNDVWESADGGRSWTQLADAPWTARSYHTAKISKGQLYLVGGHNNDTWFSDVWRTADGRSWEQRTPHAEWKARAAAALQPIGDVLFLMGGSDGLLKPIGNGTCMNDVWRSDDEGKSWQLVTAAAPWPAREGLQKLTALYGEGEKQAIVLTAGEAGYTGPYYNDVWTTRDGANWTLARAAATFSKRSGNLLLNLQGALYTFGGFGLPMKHDAYCLPRGAGAGAAWQKLPKAPWHGRFDYDMAAVDGSIVLLGGEASLFGTGGPYYNDVWELTGVACAP